LKPSSPRRRRLVFLSGLLPVVACAALVIDRPSLVARLDAATYDMVLRSASEREPAGRVVIVDIDERSLASVGQWPWRRDVMGRLVSSLRSSGAAVIAVDVIFAETDRHGDATESDAVPDRALADVLRESGVILGYGLTFDAGGPSASNVSP